MKFENTEVFNFEGALRGMRNPKNSWDKSDSGWGCIERSVWDIWDKKLKNKKEALLCDECSATYDSHCSCNATHGKQYVIGEKDLALAQRLIRGGSEHRKFLRQIFVCVDITAPMYWWAEFDTYKIGTVANSTSKMHTITSKPITMDCFETDDFFNFDVTLKATGELDTFKEASILPTIQYLEAVRQKYLETKDKRYWKELIRWLPESWLQTRTVTLNYENLLSMCSKGQRRFHKLNEWSGQDNPELPNFIAWARTLPYAQELIFIDELDNKGKEE